MSISRVLIGASAEAVYDVLMDPDSYPRWVVGANRVRGVDRRWPAAGTSFHHSVGVPPFLIEDSTTLVEARRPHLVELRARAWPLGEADVRLDLDQRGDETLVTMQEVAAEGPSRGVWSRPVAALTTLRNRISLARLKRLVESRGSGRGRAAA